MISRTCEYDLLWQRSDCYLTWQKDMTSEGSGKEELILGHSHPHVRKAEGDQTEHGRGGGSMTTEAEVGVM